MIFYHYWCIILDFIPWEPRASSCIDCISTGDSPATSRSSQWTLQISECSFHRCTVQMQFSRFIRNTAQCALHMSFSLFAFFLGQRCLQKWVPVPCFFFWPVLFCTQSGVTANSSVPNDLVQVHQEHLVQVHGHSRRGRGWVAVKLQPGEDERSTACLAGALNKASFVPRTMCNSSEYGSCACSVHLCSVHLCSVH